jgi:hypothetical protein
MFDVLPGTAQSYWMGSSPGTDDPALTGDVDVDVVFDVDGSVIQGPTNKPLKRRELQ